MLILFHVGIALGSIFNSTLLYFSPSKAKLYASYVMISATLASGTYLVISTHARILQSCMMGLLYLGVVSVGTVSARSKLAAEKIKTADK